MVRKTKLIVLKNSDRLEIMNRYFFLCAEEERLAALLTPEDSGTTPELRAVQEEREALYPAAHGPLNFSTITEIKGHSFVNKFFNVSHFFDIEFEIEKSRIETFVANCVLVKETPSIAPEVLPVNPKQEDENRLDPFGNFKYDEQYLAEVDEMKDFFVNILATTDWDKELIFLKAIH